jgi:DNA polymerase I-like protein with 3'-5' exonuclease and polymerase domains
MNTYEVVRHAERLPAIAEEIAQAEVISLDLETTGLTPHSSKIRLLSINTGKGVYVIDAFATGTLEPVIQALRDSKGVKVGHNLKFDQKFLLHYFDLELWPIFDTYRASCLVYNGQFMGKGTQDLYALYSRELQIGPEAPENGASDWTSPVLNQGQLDYAAEDVIHLPKLRDSLKPKLRENRLNSVAMIEFHAILPEAAMELAGFAFDKEAWLRLAESNGVQAKKLQRELLHELPHPAKQIALPGFDPDFNLNSPDQLLKSLRMIGLRIDNTSEITLAMCAKDFPIIKKILEWRGYSQSVKTFGVEYLKHISPVTQRIHTNYYPFTGAGRYASSDPNLQQIPRKKEFRACFRAPPGKKLVVSDYSQIELRIAAELAEDETLMGVYQRGEDAHAQTASLVSNIPLDQVKKEQRQMAKAVNFGLIYGMAAPKLVQYAQANYGVSMSVPEAETFRNRYFEGYAGIKSWHRDIFSDHNKRSGMTRTVAGRLRYLKPESHNEFANTPVQGTGADGLKCSLWLVYERMKKYNGAARMIHMVHDEIIVEADEDPDLLKSVQRDLEEGMIEGIQPMLRKVPVVVEGGIGESWAEK